MIFIFFNSEVEYEKSKLSLPDLLMVVFAILPSLKSISMASNNELLNVTLSISNFELIIFRWSSPNLLLSNIVFLIITSELKKFIAPEINLEVSFGADKFFINA